MELGQRLRYIDWLRGAACLGMFEVHCYDAWLGGSARNSSFFRWSQLSGTLPAPLFIFLSGLSLALLTSKMRRKGAPANDIAWRVIRRGAQIFALALLFRVQEYVLGQPWAPRTDLLRVDVLNMMGLSIIFMGVFCWLVRTRAAGIILASAMALGIALATPPLWTTMRPRWLPWYIESYINGVHIYHAPQPWLFPIFPWAAFAFTGLAVGFLLFDDRPAGASWISQNPGRVMGLLAAAGAALFCLSLWLDGRHAQLYSVYDYWHTSPNFFLARLGILLMVLVGGYAWCRWGPGRTGFSPLMRLGQASLLVYWVHTEFVYGRFTILTRQAQTIPMASLGLLLIFTVMVLLATARIRSKGRGAEMLARFRRALRPTAEEA